MKLKKECFGCKISLLCLTRQCDIWQPKWRKMACSLCGEEHLVFDVQDAYLGGTMDEKVRLLEYFKCSEYSRVNIFRGMFCTRCFTVSTVEQLLQKADEVKKSII